MKKRLGLWLVGTVGAMALTGSAYAGDISININRAQSTLNCNVGYYEMLYHHKVPSIDFRIRGTVTESLSPLVPTGLVLVSLNTNRVLLEQGPYRMAVDITGRIGYTPALTTPMPVVMPTGSADIDLVGDLDESTVSLRTPPGPYVGVLVITATSPL